MTDSVYLRLAGPLQSWAKPAVSGNFINTQMIPTESALQGLVAGALGYPRGRWPKWISSIDFAVREDRRPQIVDDFHTIGSREDEYEFRRRLAILQRLPARTAKSIAFKPGVGATVISRRTYLADAEFLVRMTLDGHTEDLDKAASDPVFSTYLGRKAFPASFPFYLGVGNADLMNLIPAVDEKAGTGSRVSVKLYTLGMGPGARPSQMQVPAVGDRNAWFDAVTDLGLKRRCTV